MCIKAIKLKSKKEEWIVEKNWEQKWKRHYKEEEEIKPCTVLKPVLIEREKKNTQ